MAAAQSNYCAKLKHGCSHCPTWQSWFEIIKAVYKPVPRRVERIKGLGAKMLKIVLYNENRPIEFQQIADELRRGLGALWAAATGWEMWPSDG